MRRSTVAVPLAVLAICVAAGACAAGSKGGAGSGGGKPDGGAGQSDTGTLVGDGSSLEAPSLDAGCATATAKANRAPVYILFLLDGSGSMSEENKWPAATGALVDLIGSMSNDPSIGVGLTVFADTSDKTQGAGPYPEPGIDVSIGEVTTAQSAALAGRLTALPKGATPTYEALQGSYGELSGFTASSPLQSGGKKVLVLLTDGVPTDPQCATPDAGASYPTNPCVVMAGASAASAPPGGPVLTFVIGIGAFPSSNTQDFDPAWLGYLAQAGGGAPAGCDPSQTQTSTNLCYLEIDPTQADSGSSLQGEFATALQSIRHQVLGCTFPLESTGLGKVDPTKVNVQVDGQVVPQSLTDGWTYDDPSDPTAIVFNGPACDALKNDPSADVEVIVGCETETAK
jgi:hypothetical protein